jgi:uncharacterized protein (TIGR02270 family)
VDTASRPPVSVVLQQYADDTAALRLTRSVLVRAPHVGLLHLGRLDERIEAHLDGLVGAGRRASEICAGTLASPDVGEVFTATCCAIAMRDAETLGKLLAISETVTAAERGLVSAFGWASASDLTDLVRRLATARHPFHRRVALATFGVHRIDPGDALITAMNDGDASLRSCAFHVAAQCGRVDLAPVSITEACANDIGCNYFAARAALLLGSRSLAIRSLREQLEADGPCQSAALELWLLAAGEQEADELLKRLLESGASRLVIRGVGLSGNPRYLPWLLAQMREQVWARAAGEAFTLITGADLAELDLESREPAPEATVPSDQPDDDNVDLEADEGLPWPDPDRVTGWWHANKNRFQPGTRHFMGDPVTRQHCMEVLKNGSQRQRILAAHYLCLFEPGTPLFNTSAPARRQQRLLEQM